MKHILVLLSLMTLATPGIAQYVGPTFNLEFFVNFSGISNSPPYPGPYVVADYYRTKPPVLVNMPTLSNWLGISVGLQTTPEDAWILEKQADGSFSIVADLTNPAEVVIGGLPLLPPLTTNQVHSLIQGNCYLKVDFEDGSYIGNLAPQYSEANGPTANVVFPPANFPGVENGYTAITSGKGTAKVVFDGSQCKDPFFLPMTYAWKGWDEDSVSSIPMFTSTNLMATNVFAPGVYEIGLQADDIIADGLPFYFNLRVITEGQAVDSIISIIQFSPLLKNRSQLLIDILSTAKGLVNKGDTAQACAELELFEFFVRAAHFESATTSSLLLTTQALIEAVNPH